jgi:hypothetical protein
VLLETCWEHIGNNKIQKVQPHPPTPPLKVKKMGGLLAH